MNRLYFGDNLYVLRQHVGNESVDLVYLVNSKRDYNLLFKTPRGYKPDAQITAFEASWHWGEQAEAEYAEILRQPNTDELMPVLRSFLGENDMMAYLVMMANRLHRVLLERIINASSNPGDVVLDPFCGCGTAVHAARKLERRWIWIDITHLAIALIEKRLKGATSSRTNPFWFNPRTSASIRGQSSCGASAASGTRP